MPPASSTASSTSSTVNSRSQCALGGHCRAANALVCWADAVSPGSIPGWCTLLWWVGEMDRWRRPSTRTGLSNHGHMIVWNQRQLSSVGTAGLQLREPDLSEHCSTSSASAMCHTKFRLTAKEMPDKMQDRLWNFVIECRNRCQTEFESSWHIICDVLPNRTWSGMSGYVKWIARWDVKIICLFRDRLMDFPLTMQISSFRVGKAESKNIFQGRLLWSSKIVFCLPLSGNGVKYYIYNISVFDAP